MRANWTTWILVGAATLLLMAFKRLDLVAVVAPASVAVSLLAGWISADRTGQRKL